VTYYYLKAENGGSVVIDNSKLWTTESLLFMSRSNQQPNVLCLLTPNLALVFPGQPFWIVGFVGSLFPIRPFRYSQQPIKRSFNRLLICLVTRGDQKEIVHRSITSMQDICKKHSDRVSLHIVTEERNAGVFYGLFRDHVRIHAVPSAYRALKAKYKARSLEWFRQKMELQDDDWVLHLDEETILDEYAIKTCLDFMTKQTETDVGTVGPPITSPTLEITSWTDRRAKDTLC
jgi:cellulose synthase/poly-beta-1,6-N-acetylglucosamine synthase-like glycosyltransferase